MTNNNNKDLSQCPQCLCMTKTVEGDCGKCGGEKEESILEEFEIRFSWRLICGCCEGRGCEHCDHDGDYNGKILTWLKKALKKKEIELAARYAAELSNLDQKHTMEKAEMLEKFKDCLPSHKEGIKNKKDEEYGFSYPHCDECRGYEECNCEGFNECLYEIKQKAKDKYGWDLTNKL